MSKFAGVFLAVTALFAGPAVAQQTTFTGADAVISHIVDGDGWKTSISLNNIDAGPSQYKISFFAENGAPLSLQTNLGTGTFVYGTIPARGTVVVETAGTKVALSQGWAKMETIFQVPGPGVVITPGATVAGTVLFLRPPTVPRPIEVSEPVDFSLEQRWVLPFDHLNGYSSGVALVNQETFQDISVFVSFFDEAGNQIGAVDAFTLLRGNHLSFTVTDRYPPTVGKRGTIKIESSSVPLNVLGFRVSPTGFFTSTSPISWF
jgi:hypothetical protein